MLVIISYWHFSGIDGRLKVCIDLQPQRLEINMFILSFTGNTTTGNPDDEHPGWSELVFHSPSYRSSMMMMSSSLWWRYVSISYFQKQAGYHLQWSSPITSLPRRTGCPPCTEQREEIHRILEASMEWTCGKHWLGTGTYINIHGSICIGNYMNLQIQGLTQELDATQYWWTAGNRSGGFLNFWKRCKHVSDIQVRVGDWKLVKGTTYEGAWDSWWVGTILV